MNGFRFQSWMAGIREWRIALLVSILCMAAITVVILRPDLFIRHDTNTVAQKSHYQVPLQSTPPEQQKPASKPKGVAPKSEARHAEKSIAKAPTTHATPPPAHTEPAATPPSSNRYYVQIAAFRKRALAEKMITKLRYSGLHLQIVAKGGMHAVWAGPWATRKQADSVKAEIDKKIHLKGFVTRK